MMTFSEDLAPLLARTFGNQKVRVLWYAEPRIKDDVAAYYAIYKKMVGERARWNMVYSQPLFDELFLLDKDVILLIAEVNGSIIAGGWFIRDGNSLFYWQCAMNYAF